MKAGKERKRQKLGVSKEKGGGEIEELGKKGATVSSKVTPGDAVGRGSLLWHLGHSLGNGPPNPACSTMLRPPDLMLFLAVEFRPLPAKQELSALRPVLETLVHLMRWSPLSLMLW